MVFLSLRMDTVCIYIVHFIQNMIWVCLKMGDKLFLAFGGK